MFGKHKQLPPTETPVLYGSTNGGACLCPNSFLVIPDVSSLPVNGSTAVPQSLPALGNPAFNIAGISMRNSHNVFKTDDVTPNVYETVSVKPNYVHPLYVIPIPGIGLDGIRENDD